MKPFERQSHAVARVLFERWNPIGIGTDGPKDEYDAYAPRVMSLVGRSSTDVEIAEYRDGYLRFTNPRNTYCKIPPFL